MAHATIATPDGPFTILTGTASAPSAVLGSGWVDEVGYLEDLVGLSWVRSLTATPQDEEILDWAISAVEAYYSGDLAVPETLPVYQLGGPFISAAWHAMRGVPPAKTVTYTELAELAGNPRAVRAAATACATNRAALFVPCHRVLRTDGTLGGFRYGLEIKQSLLEREAGN